jgi:hypothetical protein
MKFCELLKIKLLFFGLFFAATTHARDPLPKIENPADFQNFLEQGALCENEWATANIFKGYGREQDTNRMNRLKALGEMLQRHHFETKFSSSNLCNFQLTIYPGQHKSQIWAMDVSAVHIGRSDGESYFWASLSAGKDSIKRKLTESGYKQEPFGEGLFYPRYISDPVKAQDSRNISDQVRILVREIPSQKSSVLFGCYHFDKISFSYRTCPW